MQSQLAVEGATVVDLFGLDRRGRRRSAGNSGSAMRGRTHPNRGKKYGPNPMTSTQVHALLQACTSNGPPLQVLGRMRLRAAIVVMWRAGLRCAELLDLEEADLDPTEGSITVRNGKGRDGRSEIAGMDAFGWRELIWPSVCQVGVRVCVGLVAGGGGLVGGPGRRARCRRCQSEMRGLGTSGPGFVLPACAV